MTSQFDRIAAFVASPEAPDTALNMAALLLIDTLGVGAGAHRLEPSRIARAFAYDFHASAHPDNSARLLFDGRRVAIPGAAFATATQIDNLDGHDGYNPTKGHIGCAVVPTLLAFADAHPELTGPEALQILTMSL